MTAEIEGFIRDEAGVRGIDAQTALDVAKSEGGLDEYCAEGKFSTGYSYWAYQLHYAMAGMPGVTAPTAGMGEGFTELTGWAPGDPEAWRDACRYALNRAKSEGWGAWYGAAAIGITGYDGIDRSVAWDPSSQVWDYEVMGGSVATPVYDPSYPALAQNDDWSCSCTSARWALHAYGRTQTTEQWIESEMLKDGIVTTQYGLTDASGGQLAAWLRDEYGPPEYGGYTASNDPTVSFGDVAAEAAEMRHPLLIGGRQWCHWSGVAGFDGSRLILKNPAPGWMGVGQHMSSAQFAYLGPFSLVRLTHPSEQRTDPAPRPPTEDAYGPWRATVGSGLIAMLAEDGALPAQRASTWLPLGASPADVETVYGDNGVLYSWLLGPNRGYRTRPS